MDTRGYRLGYRGDIEGLRAVAILLVVAAHAGIPWLAGGFVGVDVFFVLSGYLITGLLLQEITQTGHLRFANFYARRLRRLLPALLTMLTCTCLAAVAALSPAAQGDQAAAAATASVWMSNIHFAFGKLDYFSPGAAGNLFLHTWSLGVEEQFYLVWPALMVWALGKESDQAKRTQRLKTAMVAIAVISMLACLVSTDVAPQMAFYMMPWRAWQFAAGALVWLYFNPSTRTTAHASPLPMATAATRFGGWLGLGLILVAGLCFNASSTYPGWRALLPTVGAMAVIAAGAGAAQVGVSRLLSRRPLQAVGRVSYSWYLWHWPVLLLGDLFVVKAQLAYRILLVALSLLLAVASYRWVESPIRHQSRWTLRPGVTVLAAIGLMALANVLCITWSNTTAAWAATPAQQRYTRAHGDAPTIYSMGCDDWFHSDRVRVCAFGPVNARHTAVLMGDSIGAQWFPAVAEVFDRPDWQLLVITKSSCPMVDEPIFNSRIGRDYVECTHWRRDALQQLVSLRPDVVMLGSVQTYDLKQAQWIEGSKRLLRTISSSVGHIYILRSTPHLTFDGPNCLSSRSWLPWLHPWQHTCRTSATSQQGENVYRWLQQASQDFDNVTVLDMNDAVCPGQTCSAERAGVVVFRDSQHITATFAKSLGGVLERQLLLDQPAKTHMQAGHDLSKSPDAIRPPPHDPVSGETRSL